MCTGMCVVFGVWVCACMRVSYLCACVCVCVCVKCVHSVIQVCPTTRLEVHPLTADIRRRRSKVLALQYTASDLGIFNWLNLPFRNRHPLVSNTKIHTNRNTVTCVFITFNLSACFLTEHGDNTARSYGNSGSVRGYV